MEIPFAFFEDGDRGCIVHVAERVVMTVLCRCPGRVLSIDPKCLSISTDWYCVFYCCFVTQFFRIRGRVERSKTGLTPPHI